METEDNTELVGDYFLKAVTLWDITQCISEERIAPSSRVSHQLASRNRQHLLRNIGLSLNYTALQLRGPYCFETD
jgi:hypothetical protein